MTDKTEKTPEELIESMENAQHPVTREDVKEKFRPEPSKRSNAVPIVAIIAGAVVLLGCIISCAVVAYAFTINAPW
jgi:hypothetical protein